MKLNNLKIVIILVGIIIIFFLSLYIINNKTIKEKFTSLIGTSDNSLSTYDTDISGIYIPVPDKKTEYESVEFNVNIIPKGQEVIIFINKVEPKSNLGEFCSSNDDCISKKCDNTGDYNATGLCVKNNASTRSTGSKNTISNKEAMSVYYINENGDLKQLLNNKEIQIDTNVTQLKYGYNNVIYYVKDNYIYKYQYLQSKPVQKKISGLINSTSLIDVSKLGNVFFVGTNNKIYEYNGGDQENIVDLNISNAKYVSSYESNYIWYTNEPKEVIGNIYNTNLYVTASTNPTGTAINIVADIIKIKGISESLCFYLAKGDKNTNNKLWLYHPPVNVITSTLVDNHVNDMDTYDNTTVYYLKNNKLHKRTICSITQECKNTGNQDLSNLSNVNFIELKTIGINTVLLISNQFKPYKYDGKHIYAVVFPHSYKTINFIYTYEYISTNYPYNNNNIEDCYISMLGEKMYEKNKGYINIKSNELLNKNCNGYLKNLFPKNSKIDIISNNNKIFLKSSSGEYYKKINELDPKLLNFDTNSLNRTTNNIPEIKAPQIKYNYGECPYGTYKCRYTSPMCTQIDEIAKSATYPPLLAAIAAYRKIFNCGAEPYFCGQQDSNDVNKCKSNSVICALDKNKKQYPSQDVCDSVYKKYNYGRCPYGTYKCSNINPICSEIDSLEESLQLITDPGAASAVSAIEALLSAYRTRYNCETESYFCGQEDSESANKCKSNSIICALDKNKKEYPSQEVCDSEYINGEYIDSMYINSMYKLNISPPSIAYAFDSLLNMEYYGEENDPNINCNFILNSILNSELNNLYIMTRIRNENNKIVFKCLDTEFFNPSQDGSSIVVTDTLLTNFLNKNPTSENYTNAIASFIGMVSIDSILESADADYLAKCRNEFIRSKKCNYSQIEINNLENSCNKILYDIEHIEAKINKMEITQFKIELSTDMTIGPNICSFYLKSYKTYSNLSPFYYLTAHTNGSTSLSLIKGGHLQNKSINSNTQSQLWYFEKVDSFIVNNTTLKIFRTLIRSANGLYLEPSDGDIHGFSKTGENNVYKVNLIRKPTKYWFIVATEFNADMVAELGRTAENLLYQTTNTTRTNDSCPLTYGTKTGNSVDGYYCYNGTIYGDNYTGEKCCLHPGLTGICNTTCCTTEVCPTDMPTMRDGKCFNDAGKSCILGTTAVDGDDLCYP